MIITDVIDKNIKTVLIRIVMRVAIIAMTTTTTTDNHRDNTLC